MDTSMDKQPSITKITKFLVVTFGWTWIVGLLLYTLHIKLNSLPGIIILATLYMPTPFVAALITEKSFVKERFRIPVGHTKDALRFFFTPVFVIVTFMVLFFGAILLLGNVMHIAAFGNLATTQEDVIKGAIQLLGHSAVDKAGSPPPPIVLILASLWGAVIAGWTVNGLFALGEEYGWRGLLWEELKNSGVIRANLIIGTVWGLWHAPLILQGYNYPGYPLLGIGMMVLFTIGFSFVLTGVRELTNSVLPVAATHGMFNGLATLGLMLLLNANPIIAGPLGVVGALLFVVIGLVIWHFEMRKHVTNNAKS